MKLAFLCIISLLCISAVSAHTKHSKHKHHSSLHKLKHKKGEGFVEGITDYIKENVDADTLKTVGKVGATIVNPALGGALWAADHFIGSDDETEAPSSESRSASSPPSEQLAGSSQELHPLAGEGPQCFMGPVEGVCIKTSDCASPYTYQSNLCPGLPANVKCCYHPDDIPPVPETLEIEVDHKDGGVSVLKKPTSGVRPGDWEPDQATQAAADAIPRVSWEEDPDATRYTTRTNPHRSIQDGIQIISDYIEKKFPGFSQSIGGYSNRVNSGSTDQLSQHALGKALDIMIRPIGTAADNQVGDIIAGWLVRNSDILGVQIIIWDRSTYKPYYRNDRWNRYTGPHPHRDHIHVDFRREHSRETRRWFKEDPNDHMNLIPRD